MRSFVLAFALAGLASAQSFNELAAQATAARNANNVPQAIELYRKALQANPRWDEGWWFLGSMLYDSDRFAEGRDALKRFTELHPNAQAAWGLLGLCEFETGNFVDSQTHLTQGLAEGGAIDPQMEAVLRYHQALALDQVGQFDKSLQSYVWFLRNGAPNDSILIGMGLATLRSPLLPQQLSPDQRELYRSAGKAAAYALGNDAASAKQAFDDLVRRYPTAPYIHYARGLTSIANDSQAALDDFKSELEINAQNADAATMAAWIYLRRGEYQEALPYAEIAARNAKRSAIADFVYGRTLVETGQVERGIDQLLQAEQIDPAFLEAHLSLVTAYSRRGMMADARREQKLSLAIAEGASGAVRR